MSAFRPRHFCQGSFQGHRGPLLKATHRTLERKVKRKVYMKGKKTKLGTPHTAESLKSNKQRYHLSTGDASTELSEMQNESPEQRAASRGVKNAPKKKLPTNNWY